MISLSHLYVATRQDEMRTAAANERLAAKKLTSPRSFRPGAALKNVWSLLSGPADRPMVVPTLANYPFRG